MTFHPRQLVSTNGAYIIPPHAEACANACLLDEVFADFWNGFTFHQSNLTVTEVKDLTFSIGNAPSIACNGKAYAIRVTEEGICIVGQDRKSLIMGYMTLIDRIQFVDTEEGVFLKIDCFELAESPLIQNRIVHYCIFPETELWEIERFIRFCGALKYSHIILEFWGMLQYDCLDELAWRHAYSKEQMRPMIRLAHTLGLEVIPMFNHWGHASASRVMHGKHVVLDQNPTLQPLFSDNGWCWNIRSPKARELLRAIRNELIELCGEGEYFHIGCDEAYGFDLNKVEEMDTLCDYINELSRDLMSQGRRAIAWGDMFLYRHPHYNPKNYYHCNCPTPESEQYMLSRLSRDVVIADWQYDVAEGTVETARVFCNAGFDTLICPWDRSTPKVCSCITTVKENNLFGLLHTTWHTLSKGMPYVLIAALGAFESVPAIRSSIAASSAAALMRKVSFANGDYEKAGWARHEIGDIY